MKFNVDDITEGDEFFRNGIFVFNISKLIRYIDGHHRLAKASKMGVKKLECFLVRMEKHIPFMVEGFESYVEYWNGK